MAKLSKDNFEYFKQECLRWLQFLGIYQWDCRFFFEKDEDGLARVIWEEENGLAAFYLATKWGKDKVNAYNLSKTAFHEACELLLWELNDLARRGNRDSRVNEAVHRVIRGLENTVFEYEWKRSNLS